MQVVVRGVHGGSHGKTLAMDQFCGDSGQMASLSCHQVSEQITSLEFHLLYASTHQMM